MVFRRKRKIVHKKRTNHRNRRKRIPKSLSYNAQSRTGGIRIMPDAYFTTLSTKATGRFEAAEFGAYGIASPVGGQFMSGALTLLANSPFEPWLALPVQAVNVITYMNDVNPRIESDTGLVTLFNPGAYTKCLVYKTTVTWKITPSVTSSNDSIIVAICPTQNAATTSTTTVAIMQQRFAKYKRFSYFNNDALTLTIDWAEFLGIPKSEYMADESRLLSSLVSAADVVSLANPIYFQTSIQTLDLAQPTAPVPFECTLIHHCKFSEWTDALSA